MLPPQPQLDVVVKGYTGLLDCMESYANACDASLVVMGSQVITSQPVISGNTTSAAAVGSVTLSCLKRLAGRPMLVVTANTRLVKLNPRGQPIKQSSSNWRASAAAAAEGIDLEGGKREAPRVLAVVEHHSRGMLHFISGVCLVSVSHILHICLSNHIPGGTHAELYDSSSIVR
jgi:hypothetical protein